MKRIIYALVISILGRFLTRSHPKGDPKCRQ
jgi:hypothetical protein